MLNLWREPDNLFCEEIEHKDQSIDQLINWSIYKFMHIYRKNIYVLYLRWIFEC